MSNDLKLDKGACVTDPETGDNGYVLGPFWRKGEKWWTINWTDAGTTAHRESEIT